MTCAAAIDTFGKALPLPKTTSTREVALHLYSLRYYVGSVAAEFDEKPSPTLIERSAALGRAYDAVDTARLHIFDELTKTRYAGLKAFFWMHNWHAARHASEIDTLNTLGFGIPTGTISFGERLGRREGGGVAVLGSVVPCPATGGCTEPTGGVEATLKARYGDKPTVVSLAGSHDTAMTTPTTLLSNSNKMALRNVVLTRQFDGAYLSADRKMTRASGLNRRAVLGGVAAAAVATSGAVARGTGRQFNLLIRGGHVIDGTGTPARRADIGVIGGRIAMIGQASATTRATRTIDARDRVVSPGFIDPHAHGDPLQDTSFANFLTMGVTTITPGTGWRDARVSPRARSAAVAGLSRVAHGVRRHWPGAEYRATDRAWHAALACWSRPRGHPFNGAVGDDAATA